MGKTQKTGNLVNIVVTDNDKNVTLPKALTIGEVPPIDDDSFKVPTTSWVKTKVDTKVDKVTGKGLSTNDFTDTLKTKLDGIEAGAEVNVNADWNAVSGDAQILNKPLIQPQLNGLGFVKANGTTISYDNSTYLTTINGITAGGELAGTYPNPTLVTSAVTGKLLSGVNITGGTIVATDSILTAFGKVQNQINSLVGGVNYQGTWNASTNLPALTSSVGTKGYYYVVTTAGTTSLNGINDWKLGDWVIFNGTTWDKVDNTDSVISVNGFTGAVSLTTDNISEGSTNLYYTNTRVRGAISLTTSGSSGAATYSSSTGVLNIPNYGSALSGYVTLDTTQTITAAKTFTTSGGGNSLVINHSSGSGIALSITKGGNGEGIYVNKTSGSGNAVTIIGTLNATTLVKNGGTSSQFLKADGSVDSTSYQPLLTNPTTGTGTTNYVTKWTGATTLGNSSIFDNGNVGIATSTPTALLQVLGATTLAANTRYLKTHIGGAQSWGANSFEELGLGYSGIRSIYSGSGENWDLAFSTGTSTSFNTGTQPERMRITSTGNVGIGTTSPTYKFQVSGEGGFTDNIYINGTGNTNLFFQQTGTTKWIAGYVPSINAFRFSNGSSDILSLTNTGNVGIGTTSPGQKLEVTDVLSRIAVTSTTNSNNAGIYFNAKNSLGSNTQGGVYYVPSATPYLSLSGDNFNAHVAVTNTGNVGIGTTSPSELLHLQSSQPVIRYTKTGVLNWKAGLITGNDYAITADNIATTALTIQSGTGNVGIGTTTPAYKLDVNGNVRVTGTMTATLGGFNSDINDKKDLIYGAKSNVLDLNAVSYLRKSTNSKEYGYIAQDVKKVLPEAVYETVSGLAVSYHMVNAAKIQALQEEIKELKAKLLSK